MERTSSFGYWLRRRRKTLDLTQDELAQRVGCALGTIKKLETDQRRPSKQLAERLADVLQISADERAAFLKAARAKLATDQIEIVAPSRAAVVGSPDTPQVRPELDAYARAVKTDGARDIAPLPSIPAQYGSAHSSSPLSNAEGPLFVARQQELKWLDGILDAALEKQHRVVFVLGEAGQGKTALMQAFARRAQLAHPKLIVAGGNCNAYTGMGDSYLPFREILELLTGDIEARTAAGTLSYNQADRLWHTLRVTTQAMLEVGRDLLDTFLPIRPLLDRVATAAPGGAAWQAQLQALAASKAIRTDTGIQQQTLFEQYARVLQDVARRVPLLLLLDDLQWADRGSVDLLFHLGRRLVGHQVLIVGAYRPTDVLLGREGERHPLERVVNEFQGDWGDILLDLDRSEGHALIEGLIDSESNRLDQTFREKLYRQTGGHPLFTVELLRDMQERGDLVQDEYARWIEQNQLDWKTVPARVEGVIGERFNRLGPPLQALLQVASVEGEEFTAELVAQVLRIDEAEVIRRLSRDLDKTHRLVRAVGIKREGPIRLSRYRFAHILTQQYVYSQLDAAEQVYYNEALGHALERWYGNQADQVAVQLARHFEAAQLAEKAAVYLQHAGDQARRSAALHVAARYYRAALSHWPIEDRLERGVLLRKLGECQWMTGQLHDALATFDACQSLCASLGDREGAGAAQRLIGRIHWEQGDREQSLQHYHRALALLEQGPQTIELARAISAISQMHMLASDFGQAIAWGERALNLADGLGAEDVMVHALNNVGVAYSWTGEPKRGEAMLRESLRRGLALGLPHDTCRAYRNLGTVLARLGRYTEARATFEELQAYATRVYAPLFAGGSLLDLTEVDWFTGRWKEALARRQQILDWLERSQLIGYREVLASTLFGWMHNDLGQGEAAHQVLEQALAKARKQAEPQTTGPHLAQVARALILLGMETDATDIVHELLELLAQTPDRASVFHPENVVPLISLCRWLAGGPTPGALDDAKAIVLALSRADAQIRSPETVAALCEARGALALGEGAPDLAVEPLRRAADGWQALGRPYDQARTLSDLGWALALAGDATKARAAFDQALSLVEALAAQLQDPEVKAAFLDSAVVQELRRLLSATSEDHQQALGSEEARKSAGSSCQQ